MNMNDRILEQHYSWQKRRARRERAVRLRLMYSHIRTALIWFFVGYGATTIIIRIVLG